MKTIFGTILALLLILTSIQGYANSERTVIKCYVEVIGGGETIYQVTYGSDKITPEAVGESIIGKKIYFKNHKKKATIYKAKECVYEGSEFSSDVANTLEEDLPD